MKDICLNISTPDFKPEEQNYKSKVSLSIKFDNEQEAIHFMNALTYFVKNKAFEIPEYVVMDEIKAKL